MTAHHPPQGCEPCGDCPWCAQRWEYRHAATEARRELRKAHTLMRKLESALREITPQTATWEIPRAHARLLEASQRARGGGAPHQPGEEWQCLDPRCPDAKTMPYHSHPGPQRVGP